MRRLGSEPEKGQEGRGSFGEKPQARAGLDYRTYRLSLKEWLFCGGLGLAVCGAAAYTFYRSLWAFLIMAPAGALSPLFCREGLRKKRLQKLELEFKDAIQILASYLSAGYSIENSLSRTAEELERLGGGRMMAAEFRELARRVSMNRPVEEGFLELGERSGLEDVDNFAQVFAAAKRRGGDMVEIISHTAGIIRDKVQVQEEIRTMTASKAFEQRVMSAIPFLIVLYIDLTSPGFFDIMYATAAGRVVMTGCLVVYGAAFLMARRILEIEI